MRQLFRPKSDYWIWYPYLERPFPWLLIAIYATPITIVAGALIYGDRL